LDEQTQQRLRYHQTVFGCNYVCLNKTLTQNAVFSFQRIGWAESTCHYKTESVTQYEQVQVVKHESEAAYPKPLEMIDDPTHEGKLPEVARDAFGITPAHLVCSDLVCHGSRMTVFLGVLIVGIFVGRKMSNRRSGMVRHSGSEVEVPSLHLDEDDAVEILTLHHNHPKGQKRRGGFIE